MSTISLVPFDPFQDRPHFQQEPSTLDCRFFPPQRIGLGTMTLCLAGAKAITGSPRKQECAFLGQPTAAVNHPVTNACFRGDIPNRQLHMNHNISVRGNHKRTGCCALTAKCLAASESHPLDCHRHRHRHRGRSRHHHHQHHHPYHLHDPAPMLRHRAAKAQSRPSHNLT